MKTKYLLCFIILSLFFQCRTNELVLLQRGIIKSDPAKFINKRDFDKSRTLMFEKLSPDILYNDTIIIIEGFYDVDGHYFVRIFESTNKRYRYYVARSSIKEGKVHVDSLELYPNTGAPDRVMDMVRGGEFEEIKERGAAPLRFTPSASLIINLGIKDKEKNRFDFTTIRTQSFFYDD